VRIKFTDSKQEGIFELHHEYPSPVRQFLKAAIASIKLHNEAINALELLAKLSAGAAETVQDLISRLKRERGNLKGEVTTLKKCPNKTIATFKYGDVKISAIASISKEDSLAYRHCAKIGRQVAIRKLLSDIKAKDILTKQQRRELAAKLAPQIKGK
jgi:hypothetical protein